MMSNKAGLLPDYFIHTIIAPFLFFGEQYKKDSGHVLFPNNVHQDMLPTNVELIYMGQAHKVLGEVVGIQSNPVEMIMQSRMKPCVTTRRIVQHPRNYKLIPEFNPDELGSGKHILHQIAVHPIE